jgi:hypothetical protein
VIGEGRYRPASFPEAAVDFNTLLWDYNQSRSNYQELLAKAMATQDGRAFVLEYADKPSFDRNDNGQRPGGMSGNPGLLYAYATSCPTYGQPVPKPPPLVDNDAGISDAGSGDAGDPDGGTSTKPDAGKPRTVPAACDDLDVAIAGMTKTDVWVTRLRANLPNAALADTLTLEPNPLQTKFDNVHQTTTTGTITASIAARRTGWQYGTIALICFTAFVVSRIVSRRKAT